MALLRARGMYRSEVSAKRTSQEVYDPRELSRAGWVAMGMAQGV